MIRQTHPRRPAQSLLHFVPGAPVGGTHLVEQAGWPTRVGALPLDVSPRLAS
ncbi:MAG: hypothetical protein IVW57_03910 [Ktedonobacterales bacterium]|nr:hypothetical protein [Ktedonobacterales bacterium]